jgi:NAD(P)-dependent dehydrogenase (short-subunit alcohol dehydrogenase family)
MTVEPTVQQLFDLSGKTALITGASGYLGRAMASALAEAGADVVANSRDEGTARSIAEALPAVRNAKHFGMSLDQLDHVNMPARFAAAAALTGSIDILVNNGNDHTKSDLTNCTAEQFNRHLANAAGYFLLARHVRDLAVTNKRSASVINIGSMYGLVGSYPDAYEGVLIASPVAYHTLKGGILKMTCHLAVYWARDGVRVNALSPGPFPSSSAPAKVVERLCTKSPMYRMGKPHELKGAVVFLAGDASSYMTGQNLILDGGWTAW